MASNVCRVNFLQNIAKRSYATAPRVAACGGNLEVSTLPNKTVVASVGCEGKSLVKVAVAFRAGSRYESHYNLGASHILRSSAGLSTKNATSFAILRNIQQLGANISTVSDRETIVYILESTCDKLEASLEFFKKAIVGQEFRPWELSDNTPRILAELATISPQAKVLDLIHKAAFKSGLANSIFAEKFNVKKIGSETLQHYVSKNLVSDKAAVSGCGIPHNTLRLFAESLELNSGSGDQTVPTKYKGGEVRVEDNISLVHTIIAAEAPGLKSPDVFASAVLRYALGGRPAIKRGIGSGPLSKVTGKCSTAQALSIAHSDAGLFGIYVAADPSEAEETVKNAVKVLKKGVTDQDINRGKALLKSAILFSSDSCEGVVEDLVGQSVLTDSPKSPIQLVSEVSKVTTQQVNQLLQKVVSGPKSLATLGSTSYVPYLDDL